MPPEILVHYRFPEIEDTSREFTPRTPLIRKALDFATSAHEGQFRKTGEAYITHPIEVARMIETEWGIRDEILVASALLHDVIEDVENVTKDTLEAEFGPDVAHLVDSVSQLRTNEHKLTDEEMLKHLAQEGFIDPRVFVLKLADRLHNMRTLQGLSPERQKIKAAETLQVYTKVAESLGMWEVKVQLEDLSFQYIDPQGYSKIKAEVDSDPRLNPEFIIGMENELKDLLVRRNFHGKVESRINGYYALAKKREHAARANGASTDSFSDINDMVSFRIRLAHEDDCYALLGPIHSEYKAEIDASRFDEFIVEPRINGYRALQTTRDTQLGPIEIALTTVEMEDFNNWGIIALMREGVENLDDYVLKVVFTNTGKAIFLNKDAFAIDFAYAVNPSLGADALYVLADGKRFELTDVVPNAATIEVIPGSARRAPTIDVPMGAAPYTVKMMKEHKRLAQRDEKIDLGRQMLQDILAPIGLRELNDLPSQSQKLIFDFGCQSIGELYFRIGSGSIVPEQITGWFGSEGITKEKLGLTTLEVEGVDQPGILDDMTGWIKKFGGNIVGIEHKQKDGNRFTLKIVIDQMKPKGQQRLTSKVMKDNRFDEKIVV